MRYINTQQDKDRRKFKQDRRLMPLDMRYKTVMCGYGSCRVEWIKREDKSSGPRKYCKPHSKIVNDINLKKTQKKYRSRITPDIISQRNKAWIKNNPNYNREYYLKHKKQLNNDQ